MFKYIPIEKQLVEEKNKNAKLRAEKAALEADLDYLAMMCDIELDDDAVEVNVYE